MELSVALISKNQAWNMNRLIESVLQNISAISSGEIVLVDSASTDSLISLFPIKPKVTDRINSNWDSIK